MAAKGVNAGRDRALEPGLAKLEARQEPGPHGRMQASGSGKQKFRGFPGQAGLSPRPSPQRRLGPLQAWCYFSWRQQEPRGQRMRRTFCAG